MKLSANERDLFEDTIMYKCILRSLIYMTITRPNLSYVVGMLSQFMRTPRKPHLDVVRCILRYINILCSVEFFMMLRTSYKYMDTHMLIGLTMFQIEDQPVVSCFHLKVVLLVGVKNNQKLHYQA